MRLSTINLARKNQNPQVNGPREDQDCWNDKYAPDQVSPPRFVDACLWIDEIAISRHSPPSGECSNCVIRSRALVPVRDVIKCVRLPLGHYPCHLEYGDSGEDQGIAAESCDVMTYLCNIVKTKAARRAQYNQQLQVPKYQVPKAKSGTKQLILETAGFEDCHVSFHAGVFLLPPAGVTGGDGGSSRLFCEELLCSHA